MSGWTDERVERAKKLYSDGCTASEIAADLKGGLTRNAVIGKLNRLSLYRRDCPSAPMRTPRTSPAVKVAKPKVPNLPRPAQKPSPPPQQLVGGDAQGVGLLELGQGCKWPVGFCNGEMTFCGCARPSAQPYCDDHQAKAFARKVTDAEKREAAAAYKRSIERLAKWAA